MTEQLTEPITRVVPAGKSVTDLTVAELSWCSKRIGSDVISAIADSQSPDRIIALAYVATAWARREDPKVEVSRFTALGFHDLCLAIGMVDDDETPADDAEIDENPTDSALE
jgi:hypothetical protein